MKSIPENGGGENSRKTMAMSQEVSSSLLCTRVQNAESCERVGLYTTCRREVGGYTVSPGAGLTLSSIHSIYSIYRTVPR